MDAPAASTNSTNPQVSSTNAGSQKKPVNTKFLIFGAVIIAVGLATILLLSYSSRPQPATTMQTKDKSQPLFLTIDGPKDNMLTSDNMIAVKGKTLPNTPVAFFTLSEENSVDSSANGNFEGTIALENGINTLTITAYGENGEEKSVTLDVVYDESAN